LWALLHCKTQGEIDMKVYDYKCHSCHTVYLDQMVRNEYQAVKCPHCGKPMGRLVCKVGMLRTNFVDKVRVG